MDEAVIILESVEKTFARAQRPALAKLSGSFPAGQVTGLVGPDGAGKTTLIRLLAGLLLPTAGQVRVGGLDPAIETGRLRELIGYMPQRFGLYEDLTVAENLRLHADLRGVLGAERQAAFARLLEFTGLQPFTDRLAGRLSGGMKQKLGLGCALLGHPKVLLLDEPGVGVDPISRRELWRMVHDLLAQGLSVVWSTAYLEEAELCTKVFLLNEGKLLFAGPPSDLTNRLRDRCGQIRGFQGSKRQLLARALHRPDVLDGMIQGHAVRLLLRPGASAPNPADLQAGAAARWVPVAPRFEDAFIDVLGGEPHQDSLLAQRVPAISGARETVVQAADLTKSFGSFTAADRITFSVDRGEIFGLLGPNGAGKSTTFRMMCGLLAPTSGSARVMGLDLQKSASRARQRLGYMAQKFSLYSNLTVKQNLEFFSGAYGLRGPTQRERVEGMVEVFKLGPFLRTTPDTLPLGFKQRLALACAVMHQPDILFLDEPTSGVDPLTRREFWTHINGLVEKGITVIVTTHFMDEAEYCDRVALVFRGRIIAAGTPDDLKAQAAPSQGADLSMEEAFISLVQSHTP